MEDWVNGEGKELADNGQEDDVPDNKKEKAEMGKPLKKKKKASDDHGSLEDSNDGDEEDGTPDYIPDPTEAVSLVRPGSSGTNSGNPMDGTHDPDDAGSAKRKSTSDVFSLAGHSSKMAKMEVSPILMQSAAVEGITEEAVRMYLLSKPMTVAELLHQFKSMKTNISNQDMVNVVGHLFRKINPVKRVQNMKMYLYISK